MTFPYGSTRTVDWAAVCVPQRLTQISRLVRLQNEAPEEFNAAGLDLVRRAIFAMVLDCRQAGVGSEVIRKALNGKREVDAPLDRKPDTRPGISRAA